MNVIGNGGHGKVVRDLLDELRLHAPMKYEMTVVAIGDNATRKNVVEVELANESHGFAVLVHPKAFVSDSAEIGAGTVVMAGAVVQAAAKIGRHCIINTGATVDHDCVLGDYVHIAPGAHLCGGVHVGDGTLVGVGVGIAPGARIPAWKLVKARKLEIE